MLYNLALASLLKKTSHLAVISRTFMLLEQILHLQIPYLSGIVCCKFSQSEGVLATASQWDLFENHEVIISASSPWYKVRLTWLIIINHWTFCESITFSQPKEPQVTNYHKIIFIQYLNFGNVFCNLLDPQLLLV